MGYHGGLIDDRLGEQGVVYDGMPLIPGEQPTPEALRDVRTRIAAARGLHVRSRAVDAAINDNFTKITPGHVIANELGRPRWLQLHLARSHPRGFVYPAGAWTRAVAHLREHPTWVAESWSAAALYGVGDFSDGADTAVYAAGDRSAPRTALRAAMRRKPAELPVWAVYEYGARLHVTPPMLTAVRCLRSVLQEEHVWPTPALPWIRPRVLRAVQVVDRFRRVLGVTGDDVVWAGKNRLDRRLLAQVVGLSSAGMDSPPETILRLIANRAAATVGMRFTPQVPFRQKGRTVTVLDLAIEECRLGLMFDGAQHWDKARREKDARINVALERSGWRVLRVSHGMFEDADQLSRLILDLVTDGVQGAKVRAATGCLQG